jgi:hypothetical protein
MKYKLVKVSVEEYLVLGDAGVWVYAQAERGPTAGVDMRPDNCTAESWAFEKEMVAGKYDMYEENPRTKFYTRVELED